ncbi:MAG TPA: hypothetical protein VHH54_03875, partial [Actinomycetota bacterium]|nr:hypothetical protein [Actinomycetota bacterium]
RFTGIPNRLTNLRVHYSGKSSLNTTQLIRIWNFRTGSWTTVDSRSVGSSEVSLTALPGGTLADYVSGGSGEGDLRIGVRNRRSDSRRFFASGDELSIVYDEKQ